ncbi:hypothetical protein MSG28_000068 [Choristoneura fumiferana]|uniref:Uncharacterized protein n=1 Tax=Choristoneura fumiferana TaxID=7141 RepID=A0ACC0JZ31_CHOFU|nr:hypothetical protein MSG28_000068 [Choristoneura fumiferana]
MAQYSCPDHTYRVEWRESVFGRVLGSCVLCEEYSAEQNGERATRTLVCLLGRVPTPATPLSIPRADSLATLQGDRQGSVMATASRIPQEELVFRCEPWGVRPPWLTPSIQTQSSVVKTAVPAGWPVRLYRRTTFHPFFFACAWGIERAIVQIAQELHEWNE